MLFALGQQRRCGSQKQKESCSYIYHNNQCRIRNLKRYHLNPQKFIHQHMVWRKNNIIKYKLGQKSWYDRNLEKILANRKVIYQKNKHKILLSRNNKQYREHKKILMRNWRKRRELVNL